MVEGRGHQARDDQLPHAQARARRPVLRAHLRSHQGLGVLLRQVQARALQGHHLRALRRRGHARQGAPRAHGSHQARGAGRATSGSSRACPRAWATCSTSLPRSSRRSSTSAAATSSSRSTRRSATADLAMLSEKVEEIKARYDVYAEDRGRPPSAPCATRSSEILDRRARRRGVPRRRGARRRVRLLQLLRHLRDLPPHRRATRRSSAPTR